MNIAVTGGYGSGKSSVSRLLSSYLNATLTNSDYLCRLLLEPGQEGNVQLQEIFGDRFITDEGLINRPLLRQATFTDGMVKDKLENILHPLVRKTVRDKAHACSKRQTSLVVEVPLLFEVGWQDDFDIIVLVRVDSNVSIKRAVTRDTITIEEAERIVELQLPMSYKEPLVDYIIDNNNTFISTAQQTAWLSTTLGKINRNQEL